MSSPFSSRAKLAKSSIAKRLYTLMDKKHTNLALSADVTSASELLQLANELGPDICLLKMHVDIIKDFSFKMIDELREIASHHQFLILEDRKFADIGNTVKQQFSGGQYRIADWADLITVHSLPGPGILDGLIASRKLEDQGVLLLAEMSSYENLMDEKYFEKTIRMAERYADFVSGFITQRGISPKGAWLSLTPGVQQNSSQDTLGQRYITPEKAILENNSDIVIVGRGILANDERKTAASIYRKTAWNAHMQRMTQSA